MGKYALILLIFLAGCAVNSAVIDPLGYAPESPCSYWSPDACAEALGCLKSCDESPLPGRDYELCLAEVLDIALINNPVTKESWARARVAAAEYGKSQSTFFPTISAEFFHTHSRTAFLASQVEQTQNVSMETLLVNNQDTWGPRAQVTWTLLDFGQRRYTSEAARYMLYLADYTHNQTIQTVIEQVTLDYYRYLASVKKLEANEADLINAKETLDAAEVGIASGVRDISDVLQARTQTLLAEIELSQQKGRVKEAYTNLLETMGLAANKELNMQKMPLVEPGLLELDPLSCYIDNAMECRPDLMAARANLQSREMSLKAAKRLWTPVLDYNLDIGRTYFSGGFHSDYDMTSTFAVSMPLFTGFHIRNTVKEASAKVETACAQLKQSELTVVQEVTTSHYMVQIAHQTLHSANRFLEAAKEQYAVALSQYKQGVNTILDVVSAQASLFDARAQQAEALEEWFSSLATLTYVTGLLNPKLGCVSCE